MHLLITDVTEGTKQPYGLRTHTYILYIYTRNTEVNREKSSGGKTV